MLSVKNFSELLDGIPQAVQKRDSETFRVDDIGDVFNAELTEMTWTPEELRSGIIELAARPRLNALSLFRVVPSNQSKLVFMKQSVRKLTTTGIAIAEGQEDILVAETEGADTAAIAANGTVTFAGDAPGFVSRDDLAVGVEIKIGANYYPVNSITGADDANQVVVVTTSAQVAADHYSVVNRNRVAIALTGVATFTGRDKPGFFSNEEIGVGSVIIIGGDRYPVGTVGGANDANQVITVDPAPDPAIAASFYSIEGEIMKVKPRLQGVKGGQPTFEFDPESLPHISIPAFIPVHQETFEDTPMLRALISSELISIVNQVFQDQVIGGDGNSPNMTGLLNTANVAAATGQNTALAILEQGLSVFAQTLEKAGTGMVNGMVMNAGLIRAFDEAIYANNQNGNIMGYDQRGRRRAFGKPIFVTNILPSNMAGVSGDFTRAVVAYRQQATIKVSVTNSDDFENMIVNVRCSLRGVLGVQRPEAFRKLPWTGAAL